MSQGEIWVLVHIFANEEDCEKGIIPLAERYVNTIKMIEDVVEEFKGKAFRFYVIKEKARLKRRRGSNSKTH